jgi:hypothetical protein
VALSEQRELVAWSKQARPAADFLVEFHAASLECQPYPFRLLFGPVKVEHFIWNRRKRQAKTIAPGRPFEPIEDWEYNF